MTSTICLDENYSTTRLIFNDECLILNENKNKDNLKLKIDNSTLFLPVGEGRLRTQGYLKKSYDDKPLVSIITVVYNGEKYLQETILSVRNQKPIKILYSGLRYGQFSGK